MSNTNMNQVITEGMTKDSNIYYFHFHYNLLWPIKYQLILNLILYDLSTESIIGGMACIYCSTYYYQWDYLLWLIVSLSSINLLMQNLFIQDRK